MLCTTTRVFIDVTKITKYNIKQYSLGSDRLIFNHEPKFLLIFSMMIGIIFH